MTDKKLGTAAGDIFAKAFTLGYKTGRNYIPAGGMALTAEQVEDVEALVATANPYSAPAARLRALFPATEPAEEVKPVKFRKMTAKYATANFGFPDVTDPFTRWAYKDSDGDKWVWNGDQWELHVVPPSPAEPAEEETKAERDSQGIIRINGGRIVALSRDPRELVQQWYDLAEPGSKWQRDYAAALDLFDREAASSPVVPAPTETGPKGTAAELREFAENLIADIENREPWTASQIAEHIEENFQ